MPPNPKVPAKGGLAYVDYFSLIFTNAAYLRWIEWKHPHTWADVKEAAQNLSATERKAALARANALGEFAKQAARALASR